LALPTGLMQIVKKMPNADRPMRRLKEGSQLSHRREGALSYS